jgi:hypothetical protein
MSSINYIASTPANPNITSFLNLPAEIRNWVYGFNFHHSDPLYITATEKDLITSFKGVADSNHVLTTSRDGATYSTPSIARAYQPGIQLLRVCRQIHHEVASMLYSNDFCIAKKFGTHPTYHDTTGHYIDWMSTSWLHQIGHHKSFVRSLCVDLGSICPVGGAAIPQHLPQHQPQTFRTQDGYLQFGSFVQAVWASDRRMVVTFIDPQPHLTCHVDFQPRQGIGRICHYRFISTQSGRNVKRLNQTFQLLCNDELGMRKFRRTIGDIGIKADGSSGVFVFSSRISKSASRSLYAEESNTLLDHARYFSNADDGTLQFITPAPPRLLDLPNSVLTRIMKHTLHVQKAVKINLDSSYDLKKAHGVFSSDKELYNKYVKIFLQNTFELSMSTTEAHVSFGFTKLKCLLQTRFETRRDIFNMRTYSCFATDVKYSIILHVHSSTPPLMVSLSQVRINMMPLIAATFLADPMRIVKIHLRTGNELVRSRSILIQQLRQEALKALETYVKEDHRTDFMMQCPEVWINGHSEIVRVTSTGSLDHPYWEDPAKTNHALWIASKAEGYKGGTPKPRIIPDVLSPARFVYLYLKWILFKDDLGR